MTEKNEFEPDEVASLSSKAKWLEEELNILGQSIGSRSQVLQTYVAFLKSSEEVQYLCALLYQQGGPCQLPASSGDGNSGGLSHIVHPSACTHL